MGTVVDLHGQAFINDDLVLDLTRFAEGILSENQVKKRHRLADSVWKDLGENDELVEKIEAEKLRRIRDGSCKRELAQNYIVRGPAVLGSIMDDPAASPRHRVDAVKVLDGLAANGPQGVPAGDRFIITINLTADGSNSDTDVIHFDKSIAISADDVDPNDAARAAAKKDDGDGEHI